MKTKSALESMKATTKTSAKLPADLAAGVPSHFGMSLADHADAWWRERGTEPPPRDDPAWQSFYEEWIEWAFQDVGKLGQVKANHVANKDLPICPLMGGILAKRQEDDNWQELIELEADQELVAGAREAARKVAPKN